MRLVLGLKRGVPGQKKICVVKVANLKSCMLLAKLSCGMGHNSYGEAA